MPVWSARLSDGVREGLTIYQVQELIRSGQLRGVDEIAEDGVWKSVENVPGLARFLPVTSDAGAPASAVVVVHGVPLRTDKDGKPVLPSPEEIARMLASEVTGTRIDRDRARRLTLLAAAALLVALLGLIAVTYGRARLGW